MAVNTLCVELRACLSTHGTVTETDLGGIDGKFKITVFKVDSPARGTLPFHVLAIDFLTNQTTPDLLSMLGSLEHFIDQIDDRSPAYIGIDLSKIDIMTLEQLKMVANVFKQKQPLIATRLVGTIIDIGSNGVFTEWLWNVFKTMYQPTRPVCMSFKSGDIVDFIASWESNIAGMHFA